MTQINISVPNKAKVMLTWSSMPNNLKKGIAQIIQRVGLYASAAVKGVITSGTGMWKPPIDTGAMRRGIQPSSMSMFEPKIFIRPSSATPYAKYVHEGTSRMKARPFFKITKQVKEQEIKSFFASELNKLLSSIMK